MLPCTHACGGFHVASMTLTLRDADHADEVKVNAWEAPTQVARWKEEHVSSPQQLLCEPCTDNCRHATFTDGA